MTFVMPDVLLPIINVLKNAASLSEVDDISRDLKGFQNGMTWIRVIEAPGSEIVPSRLYEPNFDFNIYGPTIDDVKRIVKNTVGEVVRLAGYHDSDVVITKVKITVTPYDFTDLLDNSPRYVFSAAITCRPK